MIHKKIKTIESPIAVNDKLFIESPFVQIRTNEYFHVAMQYPLLKMDNAESNCLVRKEVYDNLVKAAALLPTNYRFKIWDAWRPLALQEELFTIYSNDIIKTFHLEEEKEALTVIQQFVSIPSKDRETPPVHTTGGALDITIEDNKGNELNMGTAFDVFGEQTQTAYFEQFNTKETHLIRSNRRLLYNTLTSVGFTNLPSEWWHYDYGDQFWAYYKKQPTRYRGVFTIKELHND